MEQRFDSLFLEFPVIFGVIKRTWRNCEQESGCIREDDVMRQQPPASKARHILGLSSPTITCFSAGTNRQVLGVVRHCLALKVSHVPGHEREFFTAELFPGSTTALADRAL